MKPRTLLLCFSLECSRHLIAALVVFPGKTRISRDRRRSQRHNHFHYNMHKTPQELKNIKNTTTTKIKTSCFPQFFYFQHSVWDFWSQNQFLGSRRIMFDISMILGPWPSDTFVYDAQMYDKYMGLFTYYVNQNRGLDLNQLFSLSTLLVPLNFFLKQVWPLRPPPDHTKCNLTAKSSPQPNILIFRKRRRKKLGTFPMNNFSGNHKSMR